MAEPGQIPQSTALVEASAESIGDLLSRDPERYSESDWIKFIEVYREQRKRWAAAEGAGARSVPKIKSIAAQKAIAGPPPASVDDLI